MPLKTGYSLPFYDVLFHPCSHMTSEEVILRIFNYMITFFPVSRVFRVGLRLLNNVKNKIPL